VRHFKVQFLFVVVVLALSGCFGGSDGTDVTVAESIDAQPTVNSVQAAPLNTPTPAALGSEAPGSADSGDAAAVPTPLSLPEPEPTPEPTVDRSQPSTYIVQSGDVLGLIAEQFDVDIAELRRENNLDGNLIRVGQQLTIPAAEGAAAPAAATESSETASSSEAAPAASSGSSSSAATTVSCNSNATGHCVQPGESLLGIALKYDVTVEALRNANPGVSGDLIKSGEVLNLPGSGSATTTTTDTTTDTASAPAGDAVAPSTSTDTPAGDAVAPAVAAPRSDADCAARNPEFPFFHAADGLCYANPIGGSTAVPTSTGSAAALGDEDTTCPPGRFLWQDGLCYIIPGATVTATAGPTPTATELPNYGTVPCRDGYLPLESGRCWPGPDTTPATVAPSTSSGSGSGSGSGTTTTGETVACEEPNFIESGAGSCFLLQEGADKGCTLEGNVPRCPAA
jgi:LysM repeat protein